MCTASRTNYLIGQRGEIYRDTLLLLNSGMVDLLDIPHLASQFCGLERRTARGSRDGIDHGPGAHDDVANAVAGALLAVGSRRQPLVITQALIDRMSVGGRY